MAELRQQVAELERKALPDSLSKRGYIYDEEANILLDATGRAVYGSDPNDGPTLATLKNEVGKIADSRLMRWFGSKSDADKAHLVSQERLLQTNIRSLLFAPIK